MIITVKQMRKLRNEHFIEEYQVENTLRALMMFLNKHCNLRLVVKDKKKQYFGEY